MNPDLGPKSQTARVLYVLAVAFVFVVPIVVAWVKPSGIVLLQSMSSYNSFVSFAIEPALAAWRIAMVVRDPGRLDAPIDLTMFRRCRSLALGLMLVGVVAAPLQWIAGPLLASLSASGGVASGVGYFLGVWAAFSGGLSLLGLVLFETGRLLSFENWYPGRGA